MIPRRDTLDLLARIDTLAPTPAPPFEVWLPGDDGPPPKTLWQPERCALCAAWFDAATQKWPPDWAPEGAPTNWCRQCLFEWCSPGGFASVDRVATCSSCREAIYFSEHLRHGPTIDDVEPVPLCRECAPLLGAALDPAYGRVGVNYRPDSDAGIERDPNDRETCGLGAACSFCRWGVA